MILPFSTPEEPQLPPDSPSDYQILPRSPCQSHLDPRLPWTVHGESPRSPGGGTAWGPPRGQLPASGARVPRRSRGVVISAGARRRGGRVGATREGRRCPRAAGAAPRLRARRASRTYRWVARPSRPRRRPRDGSAHRPVPQCPVPSPPAPGAYLAGEVQLRSAVERLAVLAAVRVEAAVEPGGSRRGSGRLGELGSGANIEAGTGDSIGERLRSAAIFNNLG